MYDVIYDDQSATTVTEMNVQIIKLVKSTSGKCLFPGASSVKKNDFTYFYCACVNVLYTYWTTASNLANLYLVIGQLSLFDSLLDKLYRRHNVVIGGLVMHCLALLLLLTL